MWNPLRAGTCGAICRVLFINSFKRRFDSIICDTLLAKLVTQTTTAFGLELLTVIHPETGKVLIVDQAGPLQAFHHLIDLWIRIAFITQTAPHLVSTSRTVGEEIQRLLLCYFNLIQSLEPGDLRIAQHLPLAELDRL